MFWKKKGPTIKTLMLYPNKDIVMREVKANQKEWSEDKHTYLIDEKAIYFWKKHPILLYRFGISSPIIIGEEELQMHPSMSAQEVNAVMQSPAVHDLLTSGDDDMNWTMWLAAAAAAFSLVQLLISFGVIKAGK